MHSAKLLALAGVAAGVMFSVVASENAKVARDIPLWTDGATEKRDALLGVKGATAQLDSSSAMLSLTLTSQDAPFDSKVTTTSKEYDHSPSLVVETPPGATSIGVTNTIEGMNTTATLSHTRIPTAALNATTTPTSEVTGGTTPQQMQSSMVGLLGFCIMGLIMI